MVKRICPGLIFFRPSFLGINFASGGNILDIRTMFVPEIPAFLNAYSKLVSLSSCTPIPFVRKIYFATRSSIDETC